MSGVLVQITSGRGPVECAWVVAQLAEALVAEAHGAGLKAELIEEEDGPENGTLLSALIHLAGDGCDAFAAAIEGTVQWVGHSRFRLGHKRKNWFVGGAGGCRSYTFDKSSINNTAKTKLSTIGNL